MMCKGDGLLVVSLKNGEVEWVVDGSIYYYNCINNGYIKISAAEEFFGFDQSTHVSEPPDCKDCPELKECTECDSLDNMDCMCIDENAIWKEIMDAMAKLDEDEREAAINEMNGWRGEEED